MPDVHTDETRPTDEPLTDADLDQVAGGVAGSGLKTPQLSTQHKPLSPAVLRGFNPQPEPPGLPQVGPIGR